MGIIFPLLYHIKYNLILQTIELRIKMIAIFYQYNLHSYIVKSMENDAK